MPLLAHNYTCKQEVSPAQERQAQYTTTQEPHINTSTSQKLDHNIKKQQNRATKSSNIFH